MRTVAYGGVKNNTFRQYLLPFRMFLVLIYKSDIVLVIFCGCEIWSVKSIEEIRLKVTESRVVRRIFDV